MAEETIKTDQDQADKAVEQTPAVAIASDDKPAGAAKPQRQAPAAPEGKHYFWGTGRRKSAVARVRIRPGSGKFMVNKRQHETYFRHQKDLNAVLSPLDTAKMLKGWDVFVNVNGGGMTGQAGAIRMGLARALVAAIPDLEHDLRQAGHLTRDARMAERKKPGQPGARKRFQFSKR